MNLVSDQVSSKSVDRMRDYQSLENKLRAVVNDLAGELKDDKRLRDIYELIGQHGEYGEAYRLLCYVIAEKQLAIPADMYQEFVELGGQMDLEDKPWLSLAALAKKV